MKTSPNTMDATRQSHYRRLFRKFIGLTLVCSLTPLLLVGWGIYLHYARFSEARMLEDFNRRVSHHRQVIEMFLDERCSALGIIAQTHSRHFVSDPPNLLHILEVMNRESGAAIWRISAPMI